MTDTIYCFLYKGIDLTGLFLDAALIVWVIHHFFRLKNRQMDTWVFRAAGFVGITVLIYLIGYSSDFFWFVFSIFVSVLLYSMLFFRGTFYRKLCVGCVYCSLYFVLDSIYLPLFYEFTAKVANPWGSIVLLVFRRIVCRLILGVVLWFLLRAMGEDLPMPAPFRACMLAFCGFDIMLLLVNVFLFSNEARLSRRWSSGLLSMFMVACFCMILSFFYLLAKMMRSYQETMSERLQVKEEELHEQYLEQTGELLSASRSFRHDMKNHIFCMEGLLEQKKYEELGEYLRQFSDSQFLHLPFASYCSDDSLNTILNQKVRLAQEAGIPIEIDVRLSNHLSVRKLDLCTLIANLCDNAIEGSVGVQDPEITIELKETMGYLSLQVINRVNGNVTEKNPELRTTKKDSSMHGMGLSIVREIAKKYHGSLDLVCENGQFCSFVLLEKRSMEQ